MSANEVRLMIDDIRERVNQLFYKLPVEAREHAESIQTLLYEIEGAVKETE